MFLKKMDFSKKDRISKYRITFTNSRDNFKAPFSDNMSYEAQFQHPWFCSQTNTFHPSMQYFVDFAVITSTHVDSYQTGIKIVK